MAGARRSLGRDLEKALRELGFSEKEAQVYLELARMGRGTPQEIVERTGLSPAFVYRTLRRLMDEGLVLRIGDRPQLYELLDPRMTLARLLAKKAREIEALSAKIPSLETLVERNIALEEAGPGVGIYRAVNLVDSVANLLARAKDHVLLALDSRYLGQIGGRLRTAAQKGLVLDIVQYGDATPPPLPQGEAGFWEVRKRPVPSLNLAIADRDLGIAFNPRYRYALVAEDPLLIDTLSMTFYHILWKPSQRIGMKKFPRNTTLGVRYLFRAAELVRAIRNEVEIEVYGYDRQGRFVKLRGRPVEVFSNSYNVIYHLRIVDTQGRAFTLGDRGAVKEDIAAEKIYIIIQ